MQTRKEREELSQLRSALKGLMTELEHVLEVVFGRTPLVKGNVYELVLMTTLF
jgi:hypothetical protein